MAKGLTEVLRATLIAAAAGLLAACAEDSGDDAGTTGDEGGDATAPSTAEEATEAAGIDPAKWAADNQAYLEENAGKDGVTVTESGLQYRVLEEGEDGAASPESGDLVTVHYNGRLINGTEFDSSYLREEPATFRSDRLIAGWVEALPMMKVGDKWELTIPPDLAYGEAGAGEGRIPPNSTLVFEIELLDLPESEPAPDQPDENGENEET